MGDPASSYSFQVLLQAQYSTPETEPTATQEYQITIQNTYQPRPSVPRPP
jgi:hypothetical protein